MVILIVTLALLIGGAGALALARTDSTPAILQPYGPDAPFGVGYVDGFGEHSPKPTLRPSTRKAKPAPPTIARRSKLDARNLLSSEVIAVQWTSVLDGRYETYIWVHNEGSKPAAWEVQIVLTKGATVTGSTAVNRTLVDGTWVFTSTRGSLGAGLVYLFRFSGATGSTKFSLRSCTVNGSPCDKFM